MFIPTHATQPAPKRLRQFTQTVYIIAALACSLSACQPARTGGEAASWDADSITVVDATGLDSMLKMVHEAYVKNDLEEALDKAIRCNLIAKQRGMRVREAMSDFYYGICQTWLGQVPEGLKRMQAAVGVIAGDRDSASICFLPFCYKELARTLTPQACRQIIDETKQLQQWIKEHLPETRPSNSSADTSES